MVSIRTVSEADARRCHAVETAAFSAAAAASFEKISNRIANYPEGFLVLECDGQICGFINSGCADQVDLADEDFKGMTGHRSDAPHVVILSVAVDPTYHGRGFARMMMEAFVARMTGFGKRAIHLICQEHHVGLYERLGYRHVGPSDSDHGGMAWHEMVMEL